MHAVMVDMAEMLAAQADLHRPYSHKRFETQITAPQHCASWVKHRLHSDTLRPETHNASPLCY